MSLYFQIWVDCIKRLRSNKASKENWQSKSMIVMSTLMTINFVTLMILIQEFIFGFYFYELNLPFLSDHQNNVVTLLVLFLLPCVLFNYITIFHKNRLNKLLIKYPYSQGKLILSYLLVSMLIPIIFLLIIII